MKERGKAVEIYNNDSDFNYSASEMPCRKHPSSSSVGICAYCLKERLVKLVCSECGEQRLSSCSCSDISSYRNSCSTMEVGSFGRISFLIENEKTDELKNLKAKRKGDKEKSEEVIILRRSSSSCVEVKKSNGFWRIKRLFRKKKSKRDFEKNGEFDDDKSETWVSDVMGVSRSRSLCSFRDEASDYGFSSAKISDVTSGVFMDSESEPRKSGFEPRKSGFRGGFDVERGGGVYSVPYRSVYPVKESDFSAMDESAFIDLNLDLSAEAKSDQSGISLANLKSNGGSCRITVNERGLKKGSKGHKVWKWIFRHHPATNKEENSISKP
ncbi:uncharacterized protein Fot_03866 [Forsythia ovata]|uniref:Uncharacterized protein n=1 Tax=Forsythia ovata TaxID=205694 RepID=A0ABD1XBE9_9LAMI